MKKDIYDDDIYDDVSGNRIDYEEAYRRHFRGITSFQTLQGMTKMTITTRTSTRIPTNSRSIFHRKRKVHSKEKVQAPTSENVMSGRTSARTKRIRIKRRKRKQAP